MRILQIEDDAATSACVEMMLRSCGMTFYSTDLGEEGVDLAKIYDYDCILLDLHLPDITGLEVLRQIRAAKVKAPVLVVTGSSDIDTKVKAFNAGADDYLTKPFHKDELVARIHALIRRAGGHTESTITVGALTLKINSQTVEVTGIPVHLTTTEYRVLEALVLRRDQVVTKEAILNQLYGGIDEPEIKIVDVFICKLRRKLAGASNGLQFIETAWGRGYIFREETKMDIKFLPKGRWDWRNTIASKVFGVLMNADRALTVREIARQTDLTPLRVGGVVTPNTDLKLFRTFDSAGLRLVEITDKGRDHYHLKMRENYETVAAQ